MTEGFLPRPKQPRDMPVARNSRAVPALLAKLLWLRRWRRSWIIAPAIAGFVAISASTTAAATGTAIAIAVPAAEDSSFDFDELRTPDWTITATTKLYWRQGIPEVESVECYGESPYFRFTMDGTGDLSFLRINFLRDPLEDTAETAGGDHLWLYIDGERWEYANIPVHSGHLSNVDYPPPEQTEIVLVWNGHQAVRRGEGEPWINLRLMYRRLMDAKKLEWGFKSRDWRVIDRTIAQNQLPAGWQHKRYRINNSGLAEAVSWCAARVASERAYVLPDRILGKLQPTIK